MTIIVDDNGFSNDGWKAEAFLEPEVALTSAAEQANGVALNLPNDYNVEGLTSALSGIDMIRISFPTSADGRGFSQAAQLRMMGYQGRLRAAGHVIADQYTMVRRSGFDEVEISLELAQRQPEEQWLDRADWQAHDYRQSLGQQPLR